VGAMRRPSVAEIDDLATGASNEALRLVTTVLRDDAANRRWRSQLGPCLSQAAAAELLGITAQAVAKRAAGGDLLRLVHSDGRPVYPMFQFVGRSALAGLGPVLRALGEVDDPLTIAAWLTSPKRLLEGRTPIEALRSGQTQAALLAAQDYLARSS
jgi:hypothetical protein